MAIILIGGSQRSGTSMMQRLLCQHPDANAYLYEATFLRMQVSCYASALSGFATSHQAYFGTIQGLRDFQAGVVTAFLEQTALRHQCRHLVLKEPHLTMLWPHLFDLVPDVWFLLMMRDPRDVIASMIEVGRRQKELGQSSLFTRRDIRELCAHFVAFYRPAFEVEDARFRDRLAVVHYENVVRDPRQALDHVTGFTGISFDEVDPNARPDAGLVDPDVVSSSPVFRPWTTDVYGETVSDSRVGRYTTVLTADEARQVEEYCSDFFDWFGYSRQAA